MDEYFNFDDPNDEAYVLVVKSEVVVISEGTPEAGISKGESLNRKEPLEKDLQGDCLNRDKSQKRSSDSEESNGETSHVEETGQMITENPDEIEITGERNLFKDPLPVKPSVYIEYVDGKITSMTDLSPETTVVHTPSETLPGTRGGSQIFYDGNGYYYDCDKESSKTRFLRCINKKCKTRAHMRLNEGAPIFMTKKCPHSHPPNFEMREEKILINKLKGRVKAEPDRRISDLLEEEALMSEVIENIVNDKKLCTNLKRALSRERKKIKDLKEKLAEEPSDK